MSIILFTGVSILAEVSVPMLLVGQCTPNREKAPVTGACVCVCSWCLLVLWCLLWSCFLLFLNTVAVTGFPLTGYCIEAVGLDSPSADARALCARRPPQKRNCLN